MKRFLAIALLLVCTAAQAEERSATFESSFGTTTITLRDTPRTHADILSAIKPDFQARFQSGTVTAPGIQRELCWAIPDSEPVVFLLDDSGEMATLPLTTFAPANGI